MGFPMSFSDFFLPKSFLFIFTFLGFIRHVISVLPMIALGDLFFLARDAPLHTPPEPKSATATLMRELKLLPVVKFSEVQVEGEESCAVCLYEFEREDEIRRLRNCQHIFHRRCVDRWMDHDQKTCPLCRKIVIPEEMAEAFDHRLWLELGAADVSEADYLSVT